jgi:molybdopterin-containing oxidoreductase family iron-sulfur binding subunit
MRHGMVIDLLKCVGCNSCTIACRAEHGTPAGILYHKVKVYETGKYPAAKMSFLPMPCMHCQEPPCLKVCPTGATYQRDDGLVLVDEQKCMGCKYCILACPYDSRQFISVIESYYAGNELTPYEILKYQHFKKGVVAKCDFCADRLADGQLPACVTTCPAEARYFGDLDDPESEVSRLIGSHGGYSLLEQLGTKPSVYYIRG